MRAAEGCVSRCLPGCVQLAWLAEWVSFPPLPFFVGLTRGRRTGFYQNRMTRFLSGCYTYVKGPILKSFISCKCCVRAGYYSWSNREGGGLNCGFGFSHTTLFSFRRELAHRRCSMKVWRRALIAFEDEVLIPVMGNDSRKHIFLLTYINTREYLLLTECLITTSFIHLHISIILWM